MENNIQLFKNEQFGEIRTVSNEKNEPLFVANDVAIMLGYSNPRDAISNHVDEEDKATVAIHDGSQNRNMTVITESGFYALVLSSKIEKAKSIKRWVTSEILPSIRKTGGYIVSSENDTSEIIMARAILIAQETIKKKDEKLKQLEHRNSILEPKAELMDRVMDTDQKIDIGQAAKILQLPFGRNTLFQKLREKGIFFNNRNEPKQDYINRGYFELKEKWIDRDNHDGFMVVKVLVTQKGLDYLGRVFNVIKEPKQMAQLI